MKPTLLRLPFELPLLGEVVFPAYFTLLMIGFSCALVLSSRDARNVGINETRMVDLNLLMALFGLLGARLLHVVADGQLQDYVNLCIDPIKVAAVDAKVTHCTTAAQCGYDYLCDTARNVCYPPRDCLAAVKFWRGGLTFYGGLVLATAYGLHYLRKHRLPLLRTSDLAGYGIPLGLFFGRMGCYLNGCCFGKITDAPWGAVFPVGSLAWEAQRKAHVLTGAGPPHPVHPTQLYEALGCLVIFAVLYFWLRPRKRFDGQLIGWLAVSYALLRTVIEVFRDDDRGVFLGGLVSTSQLISAPVLVVGVLLLVRLGRRARAAAPAA